MQGIDAVVNRQIETWERAVDSTTESTSKPVVSISRQRGTGGSYVARRIAEELGYNMFDRLALNAIVDNPEFLRRIVNALDENQRRQFDEWIGGSSARSGSNDDYFRKLHHTVAAIARHGGVVLVGRASNFILTLQTGFHLRVLAPESVRVKNLIEFSNVDDETALEAIRESDTERLAFVKDNFGYDINDPNYYDLIINRAFMGLEEVVKLALAGAHEKFKAMAG